MDKQTYLQEEYKEKIVAVIEELEDKLIEREEIIRLILLAMFSKQHVFLIGLPGVAKTRLLKIISGIFYDASFWEILMTKETKESKLLGEDIEYDFFDKLLHLLDFEKISKYMKDGTSSLLKTILSFFKIGNKGDEPQDRESRKIKMSMLYHHFILFDEMFKATDDLLVSFLSMLNERYYTSKGRAIPVPLCSMFSASNELPIGEKIEPFVDRILIWYDVQRIQEPKNFFRYIQGQFDQTKETKTKFSLAEMEFCFFSSNSVVITEHIGYLYAKIESNISNAGIRASNRKFGPDYIIRALKVCAWLNNRTEINESDLLLIRHMAWQNKTERNSLEGVVHDTIFGNRDYINDTINTIYQRYYELNNTYKTDYESFVCYMEELMGSAADNQTLQKVRIALHQHLNALANEVDQMISLKSHYNYTLVISQQIKENILLVPYQIKAFDGKSNIQVKTSSEAQNPTPLSIVEAIDKFIIERNNEIDSIEKWIFENPTVAEYQAHKINRSHIN